MPGKVVPDPEAASPVVRVVCYGPHAAGEEQIRDLSTIPGLREQDHGVIWVDVEGLGDAETIHRLGEIFGLHPLALEDVVNTHQRPKVEDYGEYLFVVAQMVVPGEPAATEQLSLFLGKDFVLTFQERRLGYFRLVRESIAKAKGRMCHSGPDYLAYVLVDVAVDAYFPVLEGYGDRLDQLDEVASAKDSHDAIVEIHALRSELLLIRRAIWPLRDEIHSLISDSNPLISAETRICLRDCYDHTVQIMDLVETSRELCADLREHYRSAVNTQMNQVMTVLTIIATVFIPLSFVAGLYGMNFDPDASGWNMPELRWAYGYPFALAIMALMVCGELLYFWRRGWFRF